MRKRIAAALGGVLLALAAALPAAGVEPSGTLLVKNGGFESGQGDKPEGWAPHAGSRNRSVLTWEPSGGIGGSRCLSITTSGEGNDAAWVQKVSLEPRSAYLLRGMIRGEKIEVTQRGGQIGANVCMTGMWYCSSDPKKSTGTFDWTPLEVDFASGESGEVEIACRLGHWGSTAKGTAWFDNVEVVKNPAMQRYEGEHVYLLLADEDVKAITPEHLKRWVAHLDAAYAAMADLVDHKPFNGAKMGYYTSTWYPGGYAVAGNPIYWMRRYVKEQLAAADATDDWGFGILHEMGHNFDEDGAWNFNGEFWANVKLHYAVEMLGGRVGHDDEPFVGAGLGRYWKSCYEKLWRNPDPAKRSVAHDGLQHLTIQMKEKTGWEPFRKTFRYFHALPKDRRPRTPWQQFRLFYDKLKELSGVDTWSYFTPEDIENLKKQYPDK
jgi:hypothetical protein